MDLYFAQDFNLRIALEINIWPDVALHFSVIAIPAVAAMTHKELSANFGAEEMGLVLVAPVGQQDAIDMFPFVTDRLVAAIDQYSPAIGKSAALFSGRPSGT